MPNFTTTLLPEKQPLRAFRPCPKYPRKPISGRIDAFRLSVLKTKHLGKNCQKWTLGYPSPRGKKPHLGPLWGQKTGLWEPQICPLWTCQPDLPCQPAQPEPASQSLRIVRTASRCHRVEHGSHGRGVTPGRGVAWNPRLLHTTHSENQPGLADHGARMWVMEAPRRRSRDTGLSDRAGSWTTRPA
jgi:hypothetical protein